MRHVHFSYHGQIQAEADREQMYEMCIRDSFNTMTFDGDTSTVLEDCQKEAERIINEEYGY